MKLRLEDKLNTIKMYEGGIFQSTIALKYKIGCTTMKILLAVYKKYGSLHFSEKQKNIKLSRDSKYQIIFCILSGESTQSISLEICINDGY